MAKELTELYSHRLKIEGHAFSPDTDMQSDFERRFEFEETSDQLRCIDEIKGDTITKIAKNGANIKLTNDNKFMSYPFINQ